MMRERLSCEKWVIAIAVVMAAIAPLTYLGCGGKEEEAAAPEAVAPEAAAPEAAAPEAVAPEAVAPKPLPPVPAGAPVTTDVLRLMPESAMIALALPPVNGLYEKGVAMAKRILPPEQVDAVLAQQIAEMAAEAGVTEAESLNDIAVAKGLDLSAPLAVFVDPTESAAAAKRNLAALQTPPGDAAAEDAASPVPDVDAVLSEMDPPAMVGVLSCTDVETAVAALTDVLGIAVGPVDAANMEAVEEGGVKIQFQSDPDFGYFASGNKLVLGNSLPMLRETVARFSSPVAVRYGSAECPASEPDEAVLLARMNKLMPLLEDLMPALLAMNPATAQMAQAQMAAMQEAFKAYTGSDPAVMTLSWTDKRIELRTLVDLGRHPGLVEQMGEVNPLRLAQLLPEGTLVLVAQKFNDKSKENIKKTWLNAAAPEMQEGGGYQEAIGYVNQVLDVLDDELVIALTPGMGWPNAFIMASLKDPKATKELLDTVAPMTPSDPHNDVEIFMLALEAAPIPVYITFPGNTLLLSNNADETKALMDRLASGEASTLFASLDPPLDPATPREGLVLVDSKLLSDVVIPLSGLLGGIPAEYQMPVNKTVEILREIRITSEVNDNWATGSVALHLKPAS